MNKYDTVMINIPDKECTDCGKMGITVIHWGPLVENGQKAMICSNHWQNRLFYFHKNKKPMPNANI